ncbi:hypothetical protein [Paenibacillus lentus]|uniref:Uncharacterized protein n=1 Tax=Paenibacillus lentus TaxID=1338368 RepID=A0A3S8RPX4_9BACL|nr:hypothetical protein [Paenibacillus lentus]AZK45034.1 hypothetical protein EIM92_01510 [Paenibacillus lentus]
MKNKVKSLIESKVSSNNFNTTKLVDSDMSIEWIPLMPIGEQQTIIGLSTYGFWVVHEKQGLRILDEPWKYLRLLVLLEKPRTTIYNLLKESLGNYELYIELEDIFPFAEIVKIGLEQQSDYWADLALNWFVELPRIQQCELQEILFEIVNTRWASQKLRHRVKKILRNIQLQ